MSYPVRYHCPRCGTVVTIARSGYLADRSVTPYPLEGWTYVPPDAFDENDDDDVDGIRFVCGEDETVEWDADGCGEPFYLSFVRYEDGEMVDVRPERESVSIRTGPGGPRTPSGPEWP